MGLRWGIVKKRIGWMSRNKVCYTLVIALIGFVMVGCNNTESSGAEEQPVNEQPSETASQKNDNQSEPVQDEPVVSEPEEDTNEGNEGQDTEPVEATEQEQQPIASNLPEPIEIDETVYHDNGTILTLESMSFHDEYITVNISVINAAEFDIDLVNGGRDAAVLEDNTGLSYYFMPPHRNERIQIKEGEKMSGSLIFVGMLPEEATSVNFILNDKFGGKADYERSPSFEFLDIKIR